MYYTEEHSITFGDGTFSSTTGKMVGKNTWDDWFLIPNSRPDVSEPGVVTRFVNIPGRSGDIDMSEYLTGKPVYGNRSGSWEFIFDHDRAYWINVRDSLMAYLHGKRMKAVMEDDPGWCFEGRFQVKWDSSPGNYSKVTIEYVMAPYKTWLYGSGNWLWDPFNFETDRTDQNNDQRL